MIKKFFRKNWKGLVFGFVALVVLLAIPLPTHNWLSLNDQGKRIVYVANILSPAEVLAASDYICDGVADDVELQQALNALPAIGGEVLVYAGDYHLTATVTRAINNIHISGIGNSTYFSGAAPNFSAAALTGWTFSNFRTDAGWIGLAGSVNYAIINCNENGTLHSYLSNATLVTPIISGGTITNNVAVNPGITVDGVDISTLTPGANVSTVGGTLNRLAKFSGATSIVDATNTDAQVAAAVAASHTQNTDIILTTNGVTPLINAGTLVYDLRTDRWLFSDTNTLLGIGVTGGAGVLTGLRNTGYGNEAFYNITSGADNTAVGWRAARGLTTGDHNVAIGDQTLLALTTGVGNTAVGELALGSVSTTSFNTAVGVDTLWQNTGAYNTAIGAIAGTNNIVGNRNVFIGYDAGSNELGSDKLYIDNTNTATPLIYGDFNTNDVTINGKLSMATHQINNVVDPTANQDAATKLYVDTHAATCNSTAAFTALSEPTGFVNRTDSAWTFTDGTRKLSITTGTHYHIWFVGVEHTIAITKDITITDVEGQHLVYFDTDDILYEYVNPTAAQILTAIRDKCLVSWIYWDATGNVGVYVGEERHGTIMDGMTHYNLHNTRGLQFVSGLPMSDFVIGDGSLNTHAQFGVDTGEVVDEDISLTVSDILSTTGLPILYRDGAAGDWRTVTDAGYSVHQNAAGATHRIMWNQLSGGIWSLVEAGENDYVLCHVYATTGKVGQMYAIMGQAVYTTVKLARDGANTEISNIQIGNLPSPEMRPIATVLFETDKDYANAINARVVEVVAGGDDYVDWRTSDLPRGTVATDHGSLTGLADDDHTQYLLANGTRNLTGNLAVTGGVTIDGVDVSAHQTRHKWLGADELNAKDIMMVQPGNVYYISYPTMAGWTNTLTGSASSTSVLTYYTCSTGITNPSTNGYVQAGPVWFNKDVDGFLTRFCARVMPSTVTNNLEIWVGSFSNVITYPTGISNHVGFKIIEAAGIDGQAILSATNGGGAAETTTVMYSWVGQYYTLDLYYKYMGSDIKYYYSINGGAWTLGATHTTNRPDDVSLYSGTWLKTTSAADKSVLVYSMRIMQGAD